MPEWGPRLDREFYLRDAREVAKDLLGMLLVRISPEGPTGGLIVETEAYLGPDDPGSHAARGRTARNAAMWAIGGTAYVYRIYGIHHCLNVVTGPGGAPQAVLIRALEPRVGTELMRRRRGVERLIDLCSGPARLCQALDIDLRLNFADMVSGPLFIARPLPDDELLGFEIATSTRIGLPPGRGDDLPLRFYVSGCPYVSKP
ncbi:MAG: DNA-3-methyladenine glycosylase [Armatimonadetes bacterium]|nr:DNA-3-methyladenine glycosylase [Armatimonadota bacterium]